jgi:hypothetical protein
VMNLWLVPDRTDPTGEQVRREPVQLAPNVVYSVTYERRQGTGVIWKAVGSGAFVSERLRDAGYSVVFLVPIPKEEEETIFGRHMSDLPLFEMSEFNTL